MGTCCPCGFQAALIRRIGANKCDFIVYLLAGRADCRQPEPKKSKSSVKINITAIGQRAGVYQIIGGGVKHLCRFGLDFGLGKHADFGGDGSALPHGEIIG